MNFEEIEKVFDQHATPPQNEQAPLLSTGSKFKQSYGGIMVANSSTNSSTSKSATKKSVRLQGYDDKQKLNQLTTFCKSSTFVDSVLSFLSPISYPNSGLESAYSLQ